jgi:glutamyl-tRNA reductase
LKGRWSVHLVVLGLSHQTAPVSVRERFYVPGEDLPSALAEVAALDEVLEAAILSTCNRTELYAAVTEPSEAHASLGGILSSRGGCSAAALAPHLYWVSGAASVASHLFRVTAGLESMVLGESQVLAQVKEAYAAAVGAGTCGKVLHSLFHRALAAGKRVHRETGVGRHAVSVSSVAVELARRVFGDLGGRRALLLGAGETAELVASSLLGASGEGRAARVTVLNRSRDRAQAIADRLEVETGGLDRLEAELADADILVASTAAPAPVVGAPLIRAAMARRPQRPMVCIDIAVPRDVDPAAASIEGVYLYNIDDLRSVVAANLQERRREARRAERLIDGEVASFEGWLETLDVVPVIRALHDWADGVGAAEVRRALARLGPLDERQRRVVEALAAGIVGKLLDEPTRRLKELAGQAGGREAARLVQDLFALDADAAREGGGSPEAIWPPAAAAEGTGVLP